MNTLDISSIPAHIQHSFEWQILMQRHQPRRPMSDVSGNLVSLWVERDNLVHALLDTDDGLVEIEAYAGFLFSATPDGRMPTAGEYLDLIHMPTLGGSVRRGWEELNTARAFAAVHTAWDLRNEAVRTDSAIPAGLYETTLVGDFFAILFEDEPLFMDDEEEIAA